MPTPHSPHPVPASGLFGSTWHLPRRKGAAPEEDQFEARMVANDRSAGEQPSERPDDLGLVA